MTRTSQVELFDVGATLDDAIIVVNESCRLETNDNYRVVTVHGVVLAHYAVSDRMSEAHAMVSLVEQGWAQQTEVARAFDCDERTVRRHMRRFEEGGLAALGRPAGYPKGRPRLPSARLRTVNQWKTDGVSNREIARRLGVNEKSVRKLCRRLGWKPEQDEQLALSLNPASSEQGPVPSSEGTTAGPNLSGSDGTVSAHQRGAAAQESESTPAQPDETLSGADPKLSGSETPELSVSFDADPSDRKIDRLLACMGMLDDAAPIFRSGENVRGAGVLLAVPALVDSGVVEVARDVYGSIGPAFYGLRTVIMALVLMALLRIKRPEGLKEHSPDALGQVLGLDRAPEVKTLRRKLARLASTKRAAEFGRALAKRRVASRGHAFGFLYVDGHVRAYHGKRPLPKTHVARMRLSMPATTDYWVNDAEGDPLFVVTTEANKGLVKMLPIVLGEARKLIGDDRRLTVVFDRGGWSPKLFHALIKDGFDILTYRKKPFRRVPVARFSMLEEEIDDRKVRYNLADQNVDLIYGSRPRRKRLRLRQVTRLSDDAHQTHVLTSRRDLSAVEVAYRMFERWRQENFFKYLREEYALDALVDYSTEPADAARSVPNPKWKEVDAKLKKAYAELAVLQLEYGYEAFESAESVHRTMRGFKIANAKIRKKILKAMKKVTNLENQRAKIPRNVPVQNLVDGEVIKLSVERKHLTDLLKMVAYQAESDLFRLIADQYPRVEDEGRTLIQNVLAATGDIQVEGGEVHVSLSPLSSPHRTEVLEALCEKINEAKSCFPGSKRHLRFTVKPEPPRSLAFPGPRGVKRDTEVAQPDISERG